MANSICVDARLLTAPGIGTYLKNVLMHTKDTPWHWTALIHESGRDILSAWPHIEPIVMRAKIYSIQEQFTCPLQIPPVSLFWSPHYNIPCLPIRARRRLVTIHDVLHLTRVIPLSPFEKAYAKAMLYAATRLSHHIITGSDFSKRELIHYIRPKASCISVIHHGIHHEQFYPVEQPSNPFLHKYELSSPYILYVGSSKAHKNLKGLLTAFSKWMARKPVDLHLVIVGSQDIKQLYNCFPHLQDKLRFIGHVPQADLPQFYRHATFFVFPSLYEGFGLPPLEAMQCGCPTIVSHAGSLPEVCGDGAVYIDPHNTEELTSAMMDLFEHPSKRQELSMKGLKRSRAFCLKTCVERHFSIMEELISS